MQGKKIEKIATRPNLGAENQGNPKMQGNQAKPTDAPKTVAWKSIALAAVALIMIGGFAFIALQLLAPGKPAGPALATPSPSAAGKLVASDFIPSTSDSAIYAALEENGVEGALVEIGKTTTIVSLTVPTGADAKKTAYLALGAAGALSPASQTVTVEAFEGTSKKTYSTSAANVHALLDGSLSEEDFEKRVSES